MTPAPFNVVLISTYEMGRQPFGLASPAAWLRRSGMDVRCFDLSRAPLDEPAIRKADFVGFYTPMHTAARLAVTALKAVRALNPEAHLCFYGLYAEVNKAYLRKLGVQTILGGEFEDALLEAAERVQAQRNPESPSFNSLTSPASEIERPLPRLKFVVPDRSDLPSLESYARLVSPGNRPRVAGYTEASRGCKHLCRHCPVVPVYKGRFRVVAAEVVLEDIRRQAAAGAEHITFGDPDFFNGPAHALKIVTGLHREHPLLTYDVTIKIEHLLAHARHLKTLRETGCAFVTTAAESVDDAVLRKLEKGHTRADFECVSEIFRSEGLVLSPTFIPFTPWTTAEGYCELLDALEGLGLVEQVAPVQLGIRLLIPAGSRLLELEDVQRIVGPFSEAELVYPWKHADPRMDRLHHDVQEIIRHGLMAGASRRAIFEGVHSLVLACAEMPARIHAEPLIARAAIPYLTEPWYC